MIDGDQDLISFDEHGGQQGMNVELAATKSPWSFIRARNTAIKVTLMTKGHA